MGLTHQDMGQPERAIEVWQNAIGIAREIGDLETEMSALVNTAQVLNRNQRTVAALEILDLAALIAGRVKDQSLLAMFNGEYAAAYVQLGDEAEAREHRRQQQEQLQAIERQQPGC